MAHSSSSYTSGLLLALSPVTTASAYGSQHPDQYSPSAKPSLVSHAAAAAILYLTALTFLSFAAAEHWHVTRGQEKEKAKKHDALDQPWSLAATLAGRRPARLATRVTGLLAGVYVFALPLLAAPTDPILHCLLRVATFFAACKAWDLTLARADRPPVPRRGRDDVRYGLVGWRAHARYVWLVLSEMRYASFDTNAATSTAAASKPARGPSTPKPTPAPTAAPPPPLSSRLSTCGLVAAIPLAFVWPVAEVKAVVGLCTIAAGLEICHALVHVGCRRPLFYRPFAATSPSEFWSRHWHQAAQSFLLSLGYFPVKNAVQRLFGRGAGKAAGVLGAFSLSGMWHAWASFVVTTPESAWRQSVGLWGIFMLQGVLVLFERGVLRDEKWRGGWRQKLVVAAFWAVSIESVSVWLRYAEPKAIIQVRLPWQG